MNRRRGNFTPGGRGRGGTGASPSSSVSAARRSPNSAGYNPSSSGERTWERKEMSSAGKQMSWERKTVPKQTQLDTYNREFSSLESNNQTEIVASDVMQSEGSEISSNVHANSSASSESSCQRNSRSCGPRYNVSWQGHTGWKQAQPVGCKATSPQSIVPEKVSSVEGFLNLDRSPLENRESPVEKSCKDPESVGGSENLDKDGPSKEKSWQRNERPSDRRYNTHTGWKQAQPVAYKTTFPQSNVPKKGSSADRPLNFDQLVMENPQKPMEKSCKNLEFGDSENLNKVDSSQHSECAAEVEPFDICPPPKVGVIKLKSNLLEMNKEKRKQMKQSLEPRTILLRSGMVLLKNYISLPEQVEVVNECRKLGKSEGGFYQPGYRDGAKLNLKMMCLGKNWDPQTSSYGNIRPIDGAEPPSIPSSFLELVKRSIRESHAQISKECGSTVNGVEAILPWMSPDICLVNFYTISGRLGLHQDRDESETSLGKGLPVVSISIGDTAEFLYGDQKDAGKTEKVSLQSGDVLIFGGYSRRIFHGVSSIEPNTAPKLLLEMTNLRAGRLNLTFREY